ncbi:MAG TPA: phosphatidate cytidylyltransferase, partial [Bauldia sp.]|nr:phosphatidate cytidylyltransferase [Bauldia sp.]
MTAAAAGEGRPRRPFDIGELTARAISAAVLAAFALAGAFVGGWATAVVLIVVASVFHFEWSTLTERSFWPGVVFTLTLIAAILAIAAGAEWIGLTVLAAGIVVAAATLNTWRPVGLLYAAMLGVGLMLMRLTELGLPAVLIVLAVVWATDTGAFFAGRAIGGPKLLPAVSPKKTWAGAIGGLLVGIIVGVVVALLAGVRISPILVLICVLLSAASQIGDLFESWVKRRFGAKDASNLVPGHGGLMDRVDGLAVASGVAVVVGWLHGGGDLAAGLLL